jgi:hypothetical protein
MGFWHASDDIVAGGRQVPRDLPSPPRGQKLSGSGAHSSSDSVTRVSLTPFPLTVLCQINVHTGGCEGAERARGARPGTVLYNQECPHRDKVLALNECRTSRPLRVMTRRARNGFQVACQALGRSRVRHSAYPLRTWLYVTMTMISAPASSQTCSF